MGHGKETPRQKMIGMMYLVLTALLAMNVSAEVLEAFVKVDEGLNVTSGSFKNKNLETYSDIDKQYTINPTKAGPWKEKADQIKTLSEELREYIQSLKLEIVTLADGEDAAAIHDGEIEGGLILGKKDTNKGPQVLIGDNNDGKANDLKEKLEDYKEVIFTMIDEKDKNLKENIEGILDTSDPEQEHDTDEKKTWQIQHFEALPVVAYMPILTKMQIDVLNAEAIITNYLFTKISGSDLKFNSIEATIIPNSNYIIQGNDYEAKIFLSAMDTTQPPEIFIGRYDSTENEDGSYTYEMRGELGRDYDTIPVILGKGIFKRKGNVIGNQSWQGLIRLKAPDGTYISKPFKQSFQVAEANLVVSPTKMNLFYVGVDNPVDINVGSIPPDKIYATMTNGNIQRIGGSYKVNPRISGQDAIISVTAEIDGVRKPMGQKLFRVKDVPKPTAMVAQMLGGDIKKEKLEIQYGVFAVLEDFMFDIQYTVTKFDVVTEVQGYIQSKHAANNRFTNDQKTLIKNARRTQKIIIENIKAVGPNGQEKSLNQIVFTII